MKYHVLVAALVTPNWSTYIVPLCVQHQGQRLGLCSKKKWGWKGHFETVEKGNMHKRQHKLDLFLSGKFFLFLLLKAQMVRRQKYTRMAG